MKYSKTRRINYAIPDENYDGILDTITINKKGIVKDVRVDIDVMHSSPSDLAIELSGPNGLSITLDGPGKDVGNRLLKTYSGEGLSKFHGINSVGKWSIKVIDISSKDIGSLKEWTLQLDMESADRQEIAIHNDYSLVSSHICHADDPIQSANLSVKLSDHFDSNSTLLLTSPAGTEVSLPFKKTDDILLYDHHLDMIEGESPNGVWKLLLNSDKQNGYLINWKLQINTARLIAIANDDLTRIEGIGPKIHEILLKNSIRTFEVLANTESSRLKEILELAGSRYQMHDPTSWPRQSRLAADGNWDALEQLQDVLDGGK